MEKETIKISKEYHYLSEVPNFELPNGILNKQVTGCGGTTLALTDSHKTIICCPRERLIVNKNNQFPNTLLVKAGVFEDEIKEYLNKTEIPKILTTFDSFYKVKNCIEDFSDWRVVVDEFQLLINDSSFKSNVEFKFISGLQELPYVTYLSATPIIDKFLEQIDIFKNVKYYQLEWENVNKVILHRFKVNRPLSKLEEFIKDNYLSGNYPTVDDFKSTELVVYLNSVQNICSIIKNLDIPAEDCNIIVANTEENDKLIKLIGKDYSNGYIPLKGEKHKKFTFCTSTAFCGVDFYSECALSVVVSDCSRTNTTIDIATELTQIAGRERLDINPFRDFLIFIYNISNSDLSREEFEHNISLKEQETNLEIEHLNNVPEELKAFKLKKFLKDKKINHNDFDYVFYDSETNKYTFNKMGLISEKFQYDLLNYNYSNGIVVRKQLIDSTNFDLRNNQKWEYIKEKFENSIVRTSFETKMKTYIEYRENPNPIYGILASDLEMKDSSLKIYYDALGAKKIKALKYRKTDLNNTIHNQSTDLSSQVKELFRIGDVVDKKEVKNKLQALYNYNGLKKTAKATDLKEYGLKISHSTKRVDGKVLNINIIAVSD